ncbi:GTP cyclohydrolase II [Gimibacter soli]|uniref:GTP cyclohydrolase-2 n=1 Tax=Gimibacter soli TaxID=3024400 RepID=A0AAE9XVG8_9PROT|nr:GTP cyclohydrolase II [Gimibacter soli]WCL54618.1 GTP cyclohydrolase II [Gimibacter soli]
MLDFRDNLTPVNRAADDLRRGLPVVVAGADGKGLALLPLELANGPALDAFEAVAGTGFLMVTGQRAEVLKVGHKGWPVVRLKRPGWMESADLAALADPTLDLASPLKGPFTRIDHPDTDTDRAALKLLKWARLLPAALAAEIDDAATVAAREGWLVANADAVLAVDLSQASALRIVARALVPLAGAEKTELVSFRPLSGGIEHIAIVVGDPSRHSPVLARLHSECFTGDLLGSLKCDCGEQLRGAIKAIGEAGGGVVLYLAQEGRGIGLISKLKAYSLQDQGYDTVDANTRLGFDVDERVFAPAAKMLKSLGFSTVRLMTNNPEKVAALGRFGIEVTERVQHAFPPNPHNVGYLATKKSRTGHML